MKNLILPAVFCCSTLAACEPAHVAEQLLGSSCGTVTPADRDACCARKMKGTIHPMCVGGWQYVGGEDPNSECAWICEAAEPIQ